MPVNKRLIGRTTSLRLSNGTSKRHATKPLEHKGNLTPPIQRTASLSMSWSVAGTKRWNVSLKSSHESKNTTVPAAKVHQEASTSLRGSQQSSTLFGMILKQTCI